MQYLQQEHLPIPAVFYSLQGCHPGKPMHHRPAIARPCFLLCMRNKKYPVIIKIPPEYHKRKYMQARRFLFLCINLLAGA